MARRIDKIFRALESTKCDNGVQENKENHLASTEMIYYTEMNVLENNVNITETIQNAEIVFLNSEGRCYFL